MIPINNKPVFHLENTFPHELCRTCDTCIICVAYATQMIRVSHVRHTFPITCLSSSSYNNHCIPLCHLYIYQQVIKIHYSVAYTTLSSHLSTNDLNRLAIHYQSRLPPIRRTCSTVISKTHPKTASTAPFACEGKSGQLWPPKKFDRFFFSS